MLDRDLPGQHSDLYPNIQESPQQADTGDFPVAAASGAALSLSGRELNTASHALRAAISSSVTISHFEQSQKDPLENIGNPHFSTLQRGLSSGFLLPNISSPVFGSGLRVIDHPL